MRPRRAHRGSGPERVASTSDFVPGRRPRTTNAAPPEAVSPERRSKWSFVRSAVRFANSASAPATRRHGRPRSGRPRRQGIRSARRVPCLALLGVSPAHAGALLRALVMPRMAAPAPVMRVSRPTSAARDLGGLACRVALAQVESTTPSVLHAIGRLGCHTPAIAATPPAVSSTRARGSSAAMVAGGFLDELTRVLLWLGRRPTTTYGDAVP